MRAVALERPAPIETSPLRLEDRPEPVPQGGEILGAGKGVRRMPHRPARRRGRSSAEASAYRAGPRGRRHRRGPWPREQPLYARRSCRHRLASSNLRYSARIAARDVRISVPTRSSPGGTTTAATPSMPWFAKTSPTGCRLRSTTNTPPRCSAPASSVFAPSRRGGGRAGVDGRTLRIGGSAHLAIQVLKHWKCRVFVMSRGGVHRDLAGELGADWIGDSFDRPPAPLDSAILFAPAGEIVPAAMQALDRGGILAIAGIYLSQIPPLDYERDSSTNARFAASPRTLAPTARSSCESPARFRFAPTPSQWI